MSLWGFLTFVCFMVIIISCCSWCCSTKKRGTVLSTPVVITTATHIAPGGYPTVQPLPPPSSGYEVHQPVYPPYPTQTQTVPAAQMPMPMPMPTSQPPMPGMQPYVAPYPPPSAANMNPPSYDSVVTGAGIGVPNNSSNIYEKQAPYNFAYNA